MSTAEQDRAAELEKRESYLLWGKCFMDEGTHVPGRDCPSEVWLGREAFDAKGN